MPYVRKSRPPRARILRMILRTPTSPQTIRNWTIEHLPSSRIVCATQAEFHKLPRVWEKLRLPHRLVVQRVVSEVNQDCHLFHIVP